MNVILFFLSYQQVQMENSRNQQALAETTQMYEAKIAGLTQQVDEVRARFVDAEEQLNLAKKLLSDQQKSVQVTFLWSYNEAN